MNMYTLLYMYVSTVQCSTSGASVGGQSPGPCPIPVALDATLAVVAGWTIEMVVMVPQCGTGGRGGGGGDETKLELQICMKLQV